MDFPRYSVIETNKLWQYNIKTYNISALSALPTIKLVYPVLGYRRRSKILFPYDPVEY